MIDIIQQLFASGTSNSDALATINALSDDQSDAAQEVAEAILADPASTPDAKAAAQRVARLLDEANNRNNNSNNFYSRTSTLAEGDATLSLTLSPLEWGLIILSAILLILTITFIALYVNQRKNSTARKIGKAQLSSQYGSAFQ